MPTFGDLGGRNLEGRPIELEPGGPPAIRIAGTLVPLDKDMPAFETRRDVTIVSMPNFENLSYAKFHVIVNSTVVIICKSAEQANRVAEQAMQTASPLPFVKGIPT
jgi:hypothetical protein